MEKTVQYRCTYLEGHELVIGFWGPSIDFYTVLECYDQKFDSFVFDWK